MEALSAYILAGSLLVLLSVAASKASEKFGVPALLLFLTIGMLAGSDGPGGIAFTNTTAAQALGVIALALILFAGGLSTQWASVRPVWKAGFSLSTLGVAVTAALVGAFSVWALGFSWLEGMLLGSIVSSTDAAAVFSILRSRKISLREPLKPLLELESGSNDPMAVFLTLGFIHLMVTPGETVPRLASMFLSQMAVGGLVGWLAGRTMWVVLNRARLEFEGLYPVLTSAMALATYGVAAFFHGNGFLAVYLAGILLGREDFVHRRALLRFQDGLAWLMQIAMFLVLGLLVFPSRLVPILGSGTWLALFLMLVARPASVFLSLLFWRTSVREKVMVAWVGLRGAAPIILATFPLVAGLPKADLFFHLVFYVVLTSVLLQGPFIPWVARRLGVEVPFQGRKPSPLELDRLEGVDANLEEFIIPFNARVAGKTLVEARLPPDCLITLICRDNRYIIPTGATVLQEGDVLSILVSPAHQRLLYSILTRQRRRR